MKGLERLQMLVFICEFSVFNHKTACFFSFSGHEKAHKLIRSCRCLIHPVKVVKTRFENNLKKYIALTNRYIMV